MRQKGLRNFLLSFSLSFFSLLLFLIITTIAYFPNQWFMRLFTVKLLSLPLILYFLSFSVGVGLLYSFRKTYGENEELSKLEEYLRYLAKGEYSENFFSPLNNEESLFSEEYKESMDLILSIRQSMSELSKEAQGQFKKEVGASVESREEILEGERHRIARELHDSVSQQLFATMMMLSAINQQNDEMNNAVKKQLELVEQIINEAQSEMRALLLHLRPVKLEGKTLKEGIQQLLEELKTKTTIQLTWNIEDLRLDQTIEDHLFRIIQELLSNTLRHAKAENMEVYLKKNHESILLKVLDDGIGFDTKSEKTGNYGLENIRERILSMGGVLKILSFPNQGTSVDIKIPLTEGGAV